ncbi:DUF255 domain-containing protein [Gordonia pseudamarae]|jgi:uncharacterized protein YyaL (SSP411 family)|uniref:DUF255 domain-containing protein n=1 Tax=Gordonia pseudamarae TaxID=2831662 RepID=A0ABX6IFI3_9ACTN|nr:MULTISPECIES: thioredoxin domain-containing protein [Gordonia]MBD0020485.1 thioredoxin domain-containing protein [Gordonia sp. (in: high G+C Gram-positive bacteria)]QHN25667.1 DUF255 domain-containing protein [Gordonia pseudamarae]QHN34599.1 DUF255 domain-containing protein [Gordonia pseudamarae]
MPNRLAGSTSPYLRQHADNPVEWWEWGPEAFAEAARRDVPVLLSVGYAACHWCHVMAHESFEDADTATQMNADFVCIKVDREERPDIDAIYMNATVAMTGQGGWPMTCFLTAAGAPFYCGTYYPLTPRGGQPSLRQVLTSISEVWTQRRDEVDDVGVRVGKHLSDNAAPLPVAGPGIDAVLLDAAVAAILADEDHVAGGFGGAPKFPPSALLEGLLRHGEAVAPAAGAAAARTCEVMARGGIYDQLGGGFARYAVDNAWVVPHFEKMLYDNAQLLRAYAHLARTTGDALALRVTEETIEFLERDLRVGGGYASSLDADAGGVEGSTYVWTPAQLAEVLGEDDGTWAAEVFGVTAAGTFEHGSSTLQLPRDPDDRERWARVRAALLVARAGRPQPERDDKVVTAWNAMTVTALAEAGAGLGRADWVESALRCVDSLWRNHIRDGRLHRSSLGGVTGQPLGALDDHAALCVALFTVHQVTGDIVWRDRGITLLDRAIDLFGDPDAIGSWFDSSESGLIVRPRDPVDGATPAGASLLAEALLMGSLLADADVAARYSELLDATLRRAAVLLAKLPRSAGHWLAVAVAERTGPLQIVVAQTAESTGELVATARMLAPGGSIVITGPKDSTPLLVGRGPVDGVDAAYICRGTVCGLPVTTPEGLAGALSS